MRTLARIAYWLVAVTLIALILVSLDYSFGQAAILGLLFCPCALALERWMPEALKMTDKVYLSLAILVSEVVLILILHLFIGPAAGTDCCRPRSREVPPLLINPLFLALIMTALSYGDFFLAKWLNKHFGNPDRSITFFSDRKSVTLKLSEIAYVESNDTEVSIVTVSGVSFRNKTGIGQWENLLGDGFLRIHRSYLVNESYARLADPETVRVADVDLPVSRKYKESVALKLR